MWVNLDQLPAGKSMYTIAVTDAPLGTPSDDMWYDEVDVVADSRLDAKGVLEQANLEGYEHCRVVGVSDQSSGYVMWQDAEGDLR
jgi:hypothetical protein